MDPSPTADATRFIAPASAIGAQAIGAQGIGGLAVGRDYGMAHLRSPDAAEVALPSTTQNLNRIAFVSLDVMAISSVFVSVHLLPSSSPGFQVTPKQGSMAPRRSGKSS
jgi:hypothetical protein